MRRRMLALSAALLFTLTSFSLLSWAQAEPANSSAPAKPAARATHHKAHAAERHAAHSAQRHAPHDAERHAQRHGKHHHRRHSGA